MNWESYGTDHDEEAQLAPSTVDQIAVETNALAAKRKRERLAFGLTALLTTAVVAGVALHSSSGGNGVTQTTLSQTVARASAFRSANFDIEEGASIKCSEDDPSLYRMTNGEKRLYPSTDIAAAWDADWEDYVIADCADIPTGDVMSMPSDADDTWDSADPDAMDETDADTWDSADPDAMDETDTDTSDSADPDAMDERDADTSDSTDPGVSEPSNPSETESSSPGTTESENPGATEPVASEPSSPDASEPEASESESPGASGPELPGASGPELPGASEPQAPEPESPGASGPELPGASGPGVSEPSDPNRFDHGMPEPGNPAETEPKMPAPMMPAPMMPDPGNPNHAQYDNFNDFKPERFEPRQPGALGPEIDTPDSFWRKTPESNPVQPEPRVDAPEPKADTTDSWRWKAPAEQHPQQPVAPEPRPGDKGWNPNYGARENHFHGSD